MLKTYFSYPRLPSWTGGVPRQMSEANLGRRGGGFPTDRNPVILSEARDLHHPGLCLVTFGASPESTPPVQEGSL